MPYNEIAVACYEWFSYINVKSYDIFPQESCDEDVKSMKKRQAEAETEEDILLRSYGSQLR